MSPARLPPPTLQYLEAIKAFHRSTLCCKNSTKQPIGGCSGKAALCDCGHLARPTDVGCVLFSQRPSPAIHPCVKLISESILFGVASTSWWSNQQICTVKSLYASWTHHGAKNHLLCITNYRFKSKHSNQFMTICCHSMDLAYILPDWR
jgi:hypothetical protein